MVDKETSKKALHLRLTVGSAVVGEVVGSGVVGSYDMISMKPNKMI